MVAPVGIVLGIRPLQGHRSRFDGLFETVARAQGAAVYPPSLRGNRDPLQEEVREASLGDSAMRETPGMIVMPDSRPHTRSTPEPGKG